MDATFVPPVTPVLDGIIGLGGGLRQTIARARLLAGVDATVLLQGETGVGKEVFARAIHESGPHPEGPFVAINCGGLSREMLASELFGYVEGAFTGARRSGMAGKIESAQGGTLFLDEISEMPLDLQPYLLRVLESGEVYRVGSTKPCQVRFRLLAACNRELRQEVAENRFRVDLFYRISVVSLQIPALRDRRDDLPALVHHFAEQVAQRHRLPTKRFSHNVLDAFGRYSWPGNVRELRNVVESMVVLTEGEVVTCSTLPEHLRTSTESHPDPVAAAQSSGLEQIERDAISAAIRMHQGNLTQVARELRIARSTLYLKLRRYELQALLSEARVHE